jgi:hypothetical protein
MKTVPTVLLYDRTSAEVVSWGFAATSHERELPSGSDMKLVECFKALLDPAVAQQNAQYGSV